MIRSILLAAALLGACVLRPSHPDMFVFAVMGDTPYNDREEKRFLDMLERMKDEPLRFIVHVGDFKSGGESPCSDSLFERRKAQFDGSAHPLIYTPGDNDWTDCRRPSNGAMNPIERLARLRQIFFTDEWSLGQSRISTDYQRECVEQIGNTCRCPAHPENRLWSQWSVRFVTLNIPGSNNNVGYDRANDEEARCRNEANRQWLERAVRASENADTRALVVLIQANPWDSAKPVYRSFLRQLEDAAVRLQKPILFVHGDTHIYRVDWPFVDPAGRTLTNLTRLETFGSPFVGWVKVTVDPNDPQIFSFEPKLVAVVPPGK